MLGQKGFQKLAASHVDETLLNHFLIVFVDSKCSLAETGQVFEAKLGKLLSAGHESSLVSARQVARPVMW